jgi:uncharacterized membrane protein (DUF4010 family)
MDQLELISRLALALAIGFLVGLERGWRDRNEREGSRTAGVRTFSLVALLGGVFGALSLSGDRILIAAGFVTTGAALAAWMWREGEHDKNFSATTLVAALLSFALGAFAVLGDIAAASSAGVVTAILLATKQQLHGFLVRLTWTELRAGLLIAAMTFILLPILPDRTVDPWGALNPHLLWLMTVLIAAVSFVGHAAMRLLGPKSGLFLEVAIGGLFASTAVTLSLARMAKANDEHTRLLGGAILAAGCIMQLRVLGVSAAINFNLAKILLPIMAVAIVVMASGAVFLMFFGSERDLESGKDFTTRNPFDLFEVLRFGAFLAFVMLAVEIVRRAFGDPGVLGLAAMSGLGDVDAITVSMARQGSATPLASNAILLAVAANSLAKSIYAWLAGGIRIGLLTFGGSIAGILAGLAIWMRG